MLNRYVSRNTLALLILLIALLVIFHRLLLGEVFFWGLPSLQFYPWREYAFDDVEEHIRGVAGGPDLSGAHEIADKVRLGMTRGSEGSHRPFNFSFHR